MKYASIEAVWQSETYAYSLETVCVAHGVSRQAFYQYQQRQVTERLKQEIVIQLVCQIRVRQPRIGVRKLYQLLKPEFQHLDSWEGMHCSACSERMGYSVHHQNVDTAPLLLITDFIGIPIASWV